MKDRINTSALLIFAGIIFLAIAPKYANESLKVPDNTAICAVLSIPAIIFCLAGLVAFIAGVAIAILGLPKNSQQNNQGNGRE